jgi:hypothetical protein
MLRQAGMAHRASACFSASRPAALAFAPIGGAAARRRGRGARAAPGDAADARLQRVLAGIDEINAQDPRKTTWQGQELPYELA